MGMQVYLCVLSKACPELSNGVTQYYKFTLTASKQISVSWEQGIWSLQQFPKEAGQIEPGTY